MIRRSFFANFLALPWKKAPDRRLPGRLAWEMPFFFYSVHFVYFIWRNPRSHVLPAGQICAFSRRFLPKVKAKSCLDLQSREESLHFHWTLPWRYHSPCSREVSHWKNTYSFTTQYLLRDLLHNSLQVTKFSLLICRSVYIAWCSLPSLIVGWSGVPTRFRTIWIFKVKCSRVTFLPADCRNVAFFTTHTSLVFRYLL